jgi:hypothetical protein
LGKETAMKLNLTTTMALVAAPLVLLGGVLVSTTTAGADQSRRCSNQTLYGSYGFAITGVILGPNLELRGLAMQRYDGHGNITQVDHIVENGIPREPEWTAGTGRYHVNQDCTGSAVLTTPGNPFPVQLHFVVVNQGREIDQVVDGNPVTAVGKKVD